LEGDQGGGDMVGKVDQSNEHNQQNLEEHDGTAEN
jgi:hypothetical protein